MDQLKAMGFELYVMGDFGCRFEYEGNRYLYIFTDEDEELLSIALPVVYQFEEKDSETFYRLMDKVNSRRKYVKANLQNGSMWLFYERELIGEEDLDRLLRRMILHLDSSLYFLRWEQYKMENGSDGDSDEESCDSEDDDNKDAA